MDVAPKSPRGVRNHNPGNIRLGASWRGMAEKQTDSAFIVFDEPIWGIRALAKILLTYYRKHRLQTVTAIITHWAPPVENNTLAYIRAVAAALKVTPSEQIKVDDPVVLAALVTAIIKHENGQNSYSTELIAAGIDLALKGGDPKPTAAPGA